MITLNLRIGKYVARETPTEDQLKEYLLRIANHFDFFDQILSTRQVVQYIFNKREVESMLLLFSKDLGDLLSKNISISLHYQKLESIFKKKLLQIQAEKNPKERIT